MRAIVVGEYRLFRGPDGHFYADNVFGHDFWQRYLDVFDGVVVVARVADVADTAAMVQVDGPDVAVHPMPYYVGFGAYLRNLLRLRRAARQVAGLPGAMILRVPGAVASIVHGQLPSSRPFALEVVGDPMDVFAPGVVEPPLRRAVRSVAVRRLRAQARSAAAVAYVSTYRLAQRYPASPGVPTFAYSSASLPAAAFAPSPRVFAGPLTRVIAIGSMEQMYKGFDVLLHALAAVRSRIPEVTLTLVGGGRYAPDLEAMTEELGLADIVRFAGVIRDPEELRSVLDNSDLLVSSSRTEGLPRTIIEAQARGLPCVGTSAGATSDLLETAEMCEPGDVRGLADLVARSLRDPELSSVSARRGWANSRRYGSAALQRERNSMLAVLREAQNLFESVGTGRTG